MVRHGLVKVLRGVKLFKHAKSHFPAHFFFEIPLPSAEIPFPLAEFGKNPSVIHTTSFRFASAKLRLLNTTQQRPKNSQGFTKMF